jgi:hypothetical protein
MIPCGNVRNGESQLKRLSVTADLDLALVDLVGDLAAYRPGGKVVIFEGGGDSDFDQSVTATLFPELQENANLVSGSNKVRVRALQETLESAAKKGQLPFKFFSITDRDAGSASTTPVSVNMFSWDVYHIENYFLEPKFIVKVISSLQLSGALREDEIWDELRQCAQETLPQLIRHELAEYANKVLVGTIDLSTDPKAADLSGVLSEALNRSIERVIDLGKSKLAESVLRDREAELSAKYVESIADGTWVSAFRGRDVLRRFVGKRAPTVSYEVFRNLLLSQMKDQGYRPNGMEVVVNRILSA